MSTFYGEVFVEQRWWLDHMFILPEFHKKGIGTMLMDHLKKVCREKEITSIKIFVDPYSSGFYEKMGGSKVRMSKSSIPGREIPVFGIVFHNP